MKRLVEIALLGSLILAPAFARGQDQVWTPPDAPDLIRDTPLDYLARGVVLIAAVWIDPENPSAVVLQQQGSGLVLGYGRSDVSVITAAHVVHHPELGSADRIEVSFHDAPTYPKTAVVFETGPDLDLDLAVLRVQQLLDDRDRRSVIKFPVDRSFAATAGGSVTTIGHPRGDRWSRGTANVVDAAPGGLIAFSRGTLDGGASGGAVLSPDHRLVGMITSVEGNRAYAIPISAVFRRLEKWGIPYRPRFTENLAAQLTKIHGAVRDHETEALQTGRLAPGENDRFDLFGSSVSVFGGPALFALNESDSSEAVFYVEHVGYFSIPDALDEMWRIAVRNVAGGLDSGWTVKEGDGWIRFTSPMVWFRGRVNVELKRSAGNIYLSVFRPESRRNVETMPLFLVYRLMELGR